MYPYGQTLPMGNLFVNPKVIYLPVPVQHDHTMDIADIRRENLRRLIQERFHGKQRALADAIGREPSYISRCFSEKNRKRIGEDFARMVESKLGLPSLWMDTTEHESAVVGTISKRADLGFDVPLHRVPIVGSTQAGPDGHWIELGYPAGHGDGYLEAPANDPHAYALRVQGDSMAPRMQEGEYVLVYPSHEPQPGDEVVVRLKSGETMVKKLEKFQGDEVFLDSVADGHKRIVRRREDIEFIHLVFGILRSVSVTE